MFQADLYNFKKRRNTMKNKIGFGLLRLPETEGKPDWNKIYALTDRYLELGGTYFDTCYTYMDGVSDMAIKKALSERKPRDSFRVIEKLPGYFCRTYEDCRKYFDEELRRTGLEYFDVFMLHWLNGENYEIAERCEEFRFLKEKKEEGTALRIGFSYHDSADLLDRILTAHPEVDVVLLQINYLDWDTAGIESRRCYETAVKHGKSVFVMEPVKGGTLADIPREAEQILRDIHSDWSPADWALRFVQSLPGVELCLSGMNELSQLEANLRPFEPLNDEETAALFRARDIITKNTEVPCTGCGYCLDHCPMGIPIPGYFRMYNELKRYPEDDWKVQPAYEQLAASHGRASDCIGCGSCEEHCPQRIEISQNMKRAAELLEN